MELQKERASPSLPWGPGHRVRTVTRDRLEAANSHTLNKILTKAPALVEWDECPAGEGVGNAQLGDEGASRSPLPLTLNMCASLAG